MASKPCYNKRPLGQPDHKIKGKRQETELMTVRILAFMLLLTVTTVIGGILAQPTAAQTSSASPTITFTPSPHTPTITPTASITPTPLPTLAAVLPDREVITAANASQIQKYREWQAQTVFVTGVAFIPYTTHLVSLGDESYIWNDTPPMRLWDIQENRIAEVKNFFEGVPAYLVRRMDDLSLSQDGTRIVAQGSGYQVWDTKTGRLMGRVLQRGQGTGGLDIYNQTLVGGSITQMVALWSIPSVIPSPNSEMGPLPTDYVFDPQGILIRTFEVDQPVSQVAISADTQQVFVLTNTGRLFIYKLLNDIDYSLTAVHQAPLSSSSEFPIDGGRLMDINHERHEITYNDSNWDIVVYNFEQNEIVALYPLGKPTLCLNYSPDGKLLLLTDWDFTTKLQLFDTTTHEKIAEIVTGKAVRSCDFSWDGTFFATGDNEGQVALWGVPS
jgi:WD40 repeat protein